MSLDVLIIGAGPAGLMAAEVASAAGLRVVVAEAMPSVGRKFLMAGKSGLNLTKSEPDALFASRFEPEGPLAPMVEDFGVAAVQAWAKGLGQALFVGSSGRVFPVAMKASPLLRAWMGRLAAQGVELRARWRWEGLDDAGMRFATPEGVQHLVPRATVLALGGASWARLGATGAWADILADWGVPLVPFQPVNMGFDVAWSAHMAPHFGAPIKSVAVQAGAHRVKGEFVLSARGIEGSAIYAVSKALREGAALTLDLLPDQDLDAVRGRLAKMPAKMSVSAKLARLKLGKAKVALVHEFGRPFPPDLAGVLKALPVAHRGPRPLDEAISTSGGVDWAAVGPDLSLKLQRDVFVAGEMLDWDAPTGGYLISGCLASGRWAGRAVVERLSG